MVCGPKEGSVLAGAPKSGRIEVFKNNLLQIVAHRDLARLAALLVEVQRPLIARVIEVAALEFGNGSTARSGVDQDGDDEKSLRRTFAAQITSFDPSL